MSSPEVPVLYIDGDLHCRSITVAVASGMPMSVDCRAIQPYGRHQVMPTQAPKGDVVYDGHLEIQGELTYRSVG